MIIIGPFIFIINNYGSVQDQPPEQDQQPPARSLIEPTPKETDGMVHVSCDTPGCEWDGYYDNDGKARQAIGAHKSWCDKGKLFKKNPFGPSR